MPQELCEGCSIKLMEWESGKVRVEDICLNQWVLTRDESSQLRVGLSSTKRHKFRQKCYDLLSKTEQEWSVV